MLKASTVILATILVAAVVALYGQFLWNPIVFDDLQFFAMDSRGHQSITDSHYSLFEIRSLPYATLAWSKAAFGLNLFHFRVENLLLHAAVVLALFFFLKNLFESVFSSKDFSMLSPHMMAFSAALLFALHPVATYAVGYLVQRTLLMATLFGLLAMLAYLHGCIRNKPLWLWASVPLYYLAVFSKEHIIMLPAVLLALTVLLRPDWREWLRRNWPVFVAFSAIIAIMMLAKKEILGAVYEPAAPVMLVEVASNMAHPLSALTQSWLFFKYALLWLLPNPEWMAIDMREPFAQSLWSPYLFALGAFIAWGAGAVWLLLRRGRLGLLGFAMLFPWLMFMTEFSTVRIQEVFVLYRSYLWAAGAACLLPVLLVGVRSRVAYVLLAFVAATLLVISMDRLRSMSHPVLLWNDAVKLVEGRNDLPGIDRIYNNRGVALLKAKKYDLALDDFRHSLTLTPALPAAHNNIGAVYLETKDWQKAVDAFSHAIEIMRLSGKEFEDGRPYHGRAIAYEGLGRTEEARADYLVSCRLEKRGCNKL